MPLGTYLGENCAEFCGVQHAKMLIRVIVQSPGIRDTGSAIPKSTGAVDDPAVTEQAAILFMKRPPASTVTGWPAPRAAVGIFGPEVYTRLMTRETIASGAAHEHA